MKNITSPALRHALTSWDGALDALPVGVCACDVEGAIVYCNRRAAELLGRDTAADRSPVRFDDICRSVPAEEAPARDCPMNEVLRGGQAVCGRELVIEGPNGKRFVSANIDPLFDAQSK